MLNSEFCTALYYWKEAIIVSTLKLAIISCYLIVNKRVSIPPCNTFNLIMYVLMKSKYVIVLLGHYISIYTRD